MREGEEDQVLIRGERGVEKEMRDPNKINKKPRRAEVRMEEDRMK